jgi:hypothetical protein
MLDTGVLPEESRSKCEVKVAKYKQSGSLTSIQNT